MSLGNTFQDQELGGSAYSKVYDDEVYPLGSLRVQPADEVAAANSTHSGDRVWVFVKATGTITANSLVARQTTGAYDVQVAGADSLTILLVGCAQHAIADTKYGWIVKSGVCETTAASALTAGDHLISAAAGKVDDTALSASTAAQGAMIVGQAMDTAASDGDSVTAYISIP